MKQLNTDDSKQPAFVVRQDAAAQNQRYWPLFTKTKQDLANRIKALAQEGYFRSRVFINARDKFITVKVERPQRADALQQSEIMDQLKLVLDTNGIEPIATKNNLLFRIPK